MTKTPANVRLGRELGLFSAVSFIITVMIGSGIFVLASNALRHTGSVNMCLILWTCCGLLAFLGVITSINYYSVKCFVKIQNVFTTCKVTACIFVIVGELYQLYLDYINESIKRMMNVMPPETEKPK